MKKLIRPVALLLGVASAFTFYSCKPKGPQDAVIGDAASKVYVAPGKYDEFYNMEFRLAVYLKYFRFFLYSPKAAMDIAKKQSRC
jgi:hypothetical protein